MNLEGIQVDTRLLKDIWIETWRGKTLDRILLNYYLRRVELSGDILDLGSSSKQASYNRFIKYKEPYKIKYTDLYKNTDDPEIINLDLEKEFPIAENSFDNITCFNVLEHIYDYDNLISESYKVLKPEAKFIGSVPFLVNYHADPNDYWRYTWQTLERIFVSNGFKVSKIIVLSFGPLSAGFSQIEFMFPKIVKVFILYINIFLDNIIVKFKKFLKFKHPLGYVFIFTK